MADFTKRLREVTRKVTCGICEVRDEMFRFISCSECGAFFHKACVQPFRAEWPGDELFVCDECDDVCVVCRSDSETQDNPIIVCDHCQDLFHVNCIEDPGDRPPPEEIGDEDKEWLCAECYDEYGSCSTSEDGDDDDEIFTRSTCTCPDCTETHLAVDTWHTFEPKTAEQRNIKNAVDEHEKLANAMMDEIHFLRNKKPPT